MTWTKLGDTFTTNPPMRRLSRDARYLLVEMLVHSNTHGTDGAIDRADVRWVTDSPDPEQAADDLVKAGFLAVTPTGWQVVGWSNDQLTREDLDRRREEWAFRQRRARQHKAGDHMLCQPNWCKGARLLAEAGVIPPEGAGPVTRDSTRDGTRDRTRESNRESRPPVPVPIRPDPTGRGRRRNDGSSATARPGGSLRIAADGEGAWPEPAGEAVLLRLPDEDGPPVMTARSVASGAIPTDLEVNVTAPMDDHVRIVLTNVSDSEQIARAVRPRLRKLSRALSKDITVVRKAHGCTRHPNREQCHVTDETAEAVLLSITIPTNRHETWLDLIAYELVRIGMADTRTPEGATP